MSEENFKIIEEIKKFFYEYLDLYFTKRNLIDTIKKWSSSSTGIGSEKDEIAYTQDKIKEIYSRDMEQAPNIINYTVHKLHIDSPLKNLGIIVCELSINTEILNHEVIFNNLRISMIIIKKLEWLIEHQHVSFPASEDSEPETFPIKELREKNEALEKMVKEKTKELTETNKLKTYFFSKISHDLKNSMSSIKILSNIIEDKLKKVNSVNIIYEIIENAELINFLADNMINMINNLYDLSRIETNNFKLFDMKFDLKNELNDIIKLFIKTNKNDNSFNLFYDKNVPLNIKGDKYRINRVIQNLLSNSVKFTTKGKIDLFVTLKEKNSDNYIIQFVIKDTGTGIKKEKIPSLFQPYYQAHESRAIGSGLGLALCEELVEMMNGEIFLESELNKGTTVLFTIPTNN